MGFSQDHSLGFRSWVVARSSKLKEIQGRLNPPSGLWYDGTVPTMGVQRDAHGHWSWQQMQGKVVSESKQHGKGRQHTKARAWKGTSYTMYVIIITQSNFKSVWRSLHEVKADTEKQAPHALTPTWNSKELVMWNGPALSTKRNRWVWSYS